MARHPSERWPGFAGIRIVERPTDEEIQESLRIDERDRIASHVGIGVDSPIKPDRIALDVSPGDRVIVSEVVVDQEGLRDPNYDRAANYVVQRPSPVTEQHREQLQCHPKEKERVHDRAELIYQQRFSDGVLGN